MDQFQTYHADWQRDFLDRAYYKAKQFPDLYVHVQFKNDLLKLDSKKYGLDDISHLPDQINPAYTFTPRKKSIVAFFTKFSPLSNHYISPFEISGKRYNCVEQYLMFRKAMTFNDLDTADRIMKEANPMMQKQLGREVRGFNRDIWMGKVQKILLKGLRAKFEHNPYCANFLDKTKPRYIVEAAKYDNIYGVGLSLYDPHLWDRSKHKGNNLMGLCLKIVRDGSLPPEMKHTKTVRYASDSIMSNTNTTQSRFDVGNRKSASISEFRNVRYIHFQDKINTHRKISFSSTEYFDLLEKTGMIKEAFAELNKKINRRKKTKNRRDVSEEDDVEKDDDDDINYRSKRKAAYSDDSCDDDDDDDETTSKGKKRKSKVHDFD